MHKAGKVIQDLLTCMDAVTFSVNMYCDLFYLYLHLHKLPHAAVELLLHMGGAEFKPVTFI